MEWFLIWASQFVNRAKPISEESDVSHPRFEKAVKFAGRLAPELGRGREPALFAAANGLDLFPVNPVRRIEIVTPNHPVVAEILEAALECDNVARLEVLIHIRGMNLKQPKSLFRRQEVG